MTRINTIKARLAAATPGPWRTVTEETGNGENIYYTIEADSAPPDDYLAEMANSGQQGRIDAEFIAHAPEDIAWLVAEVERLGTSND